ncbi:hypothetical protein N7490_004732 [Penicillium lividum]|nr:hypothetical protein N7490_004732 [Penicillium lividum]
MSLYPVIQRFKQTHVAVPGYGVPILQCLMPLAARHATSLEALLTLASRFRSSRFRSSHFLNNQSGATGATNFGDQGLDLAQVNYQHTVKNLQSSLLNLQSGHGDIEEAIAISMILWISCPPGHEIWSMHLNGLIALLETTPLPVFDTFPLSLHKFASFAASHADIKAFNIGRTEPSRRLWLRWSSCPAEEVLRLPPKEKMLSGWEISSGYPETLLTIIALLSAVVDEDRSEQSLDLVSKVYFEQLAFQTSLSTSSGVSLVHQRIISADERDKQHIPLMETILTRWNPPSIPDSMPLESSLVLSTAWEVIRKAAMIYLWRGGFGTDALAPLSTEQEFLIDRYTREMCGGIEKIIQAAEKYHIPTAFTLIWPLAVIGNEASRCPDLQDKIREYLRRIYTYFLLPHHQLLGNLLQQLWERAAKRNFTFLTDAPLSLQSICLEENTRVPLL